MTVSITAKYVGQKKVQLTHGPSGVELVTAPPVDNQGDGSSFSPTDLGAASLLSCMMTLMVLFADRTGLDLSGMHGSVEKHMSQNPRRIAKLKVNLHLPHALSADNRAKLERAALTCPMHHSLHPDIEKPIRFIYDV